MRPALVIADPALMASQPMPDLAASAMNALAHAVEALYTPLANPVAEMAALRAAELIAEGLGRRGARIARRSRSARCWPATRVGIDRLRRPPRRLPDDRAGVRHAARADERGDAAALRALHGAARAARDRALGRGARRQTRAAAGRARRRVATRRARRHGGRLPRIMEGVAQRGDIAANTPGAPSDDELRAVIERAL